MITLHKTNLEDSNTTSYNIMLDDVVVGQCQLRHNPTKGPSMPEGFENNIYYEINPEFRGKGYAKQALALLLRKAKELGLFEVIVIVAEDNIPSQKVVESQNGILVEKKEKQDGSLHRKYKIIL